MKPAIPNPEGASAPAPAVDDIYERWNDVRRRSAPETTPAGSALARAFGFLRRTLVRVRTLGIAWDRERDLFRALLDRQTALEQEIRTIAAALGDVRAALSEDHDLLRVLRDQQVVLERQQAAVSAAVPEAVARSQDEVFMDLDAVRDEQDTLRARQLRVDLLQAGLADRLARLAAEVGRPLHAALEGELPPVAPDPPLVPDDLVALCALLENGTPPARAVEVSIQDARAEALLLAAQRHFGARMSSSGPSYRAPNDLWIHVDFTPRWRRPILWENAAARLAPGGRFVLVTSAESAGAPPTHPSLRVDASQDLTCPSGERVRVFTWVRMFEASS